MENNYVEIRVKGKNTRVPAVQVEERTVIVQGKWKRMARVHEEDWQAGQVVKDPAAFVAQLKEKNLKADVFFFSQKPPETQPKYQYHFEWDNLAVIPLGKYEDWWEKRLPQESRKNVRRAAKRGTTVRTVALDDALIEGITEIYNETPFRQGKKFPHYGKDFATVKKEVSTLLDRSEFIGAYFEEELIGFIKLVHMGEISSILHIVSKNAHYDKRPTNALLAKAVEICCQKGAKYLVYGHYTYGNKASSPLAEFKKRNGFEKMLLPKYYIPLTLKGRLIVGLRLHRGLIGLLPASVVVFLVDLRAKFFQKAPPNSVEKADPAEREEAPVKNPVAPVKVGQAPVN
jgi:hypothetical protein